MGIYRRREKTRNVGKILLGGAKMFSSTNGLELDDNGEVYVLLFTSTGRLYTKDPVGHIDDAEVPNSLGSELEDLREEWKDYQENQ